MGNDQKIIRSRKSSTKTDLFSFFGIFSVDEMGEMAAFASNHLEMPHEITNRTEIARD
jgi:hypothetical protein